MDANYILLDTDVVSYIFKNDTRAKNYAKHILEKTPVISFVTPAEMHFGAYKAGWGDRNFKRLSAFLSKFVVLDFKYQICLEWGIIKAQIERIGKPVKDNDIWIAATAKAYNIPLITHNVKDFENITGLEMIIVGDNES